MASRVDGGDWFSFVFLGERLRFAWERDALHLARTFHFVDTEHARQSLDALTADERVWPMLRMLFQHSPQLHGEEHLPADDLLTLLAHHLAHRTLIVTKGQQEQRPGGGKVVPPPSEPPPSSRPSRPPPQPKLGLFEVRVLDEVGTPVAAVPVTISVIRTAVLTAGDGVARADDRSEDATSASIDDLTTLREILQPRWDVERPEPWLDASVGDHDFFGLREGVSIGAHALRDRLHTLAVQPWVVRARVDGFLFDTNKSFLLPPAVASVPGLDAPIDQLRRWFHEHPRTVALVVGHTDTTGDRGYNDPLSLERAEAFVAFLRRDVGHWLAWYGTDRAAEKRWGNREDRLMLEAVLQAQGVDPSPEPVRAYQRRRGLEPDGAIGVNTRTLLVRDYMDLQDVNLAAPAQLTPHGCGESFPRTHKPDVAGVSGEPLPGDDPRQRRVEVFLFDRQMGVQPAPAGAVSPAGSTTYPEWVRRARRTDAFSVAQTYTFALRVVDNALDPLPRASVRFDDPVLEIVADEAGIVEVSFKKGQQSRPVVWSPEHAPEVRYRTDCFVEYEDDEEGLDRKLHNLGCGSVEAFQLEFSRPVTGNRDDVRADVHTWHDHGPPPNQGVVAATFQQPGPPGTSPTQVGGPGRGTVAPTGINALVVGILVGGQPPKPSDTVSVRLTATAPATVDGVASKTATANASGSARFERLTAGTFHLVVDIERAHAGGTFVAHEEQNVEVRRGIEEATNAHMPLVTIRNKAGNAAPLSLLEAGKSREVLALVATNAPQNLNWSGSGGLAISGSSGANPVAITGTSPSASLLSSTLRAKQDEGSLPATNTGAVTITRLARHGTHELPMTVAELSAVNVRVVATPPLTPRPWMRASDRKASHHSARSTQVSRDFTDENKLLFLLRGSTRPVELTPDVLPAGAPVAWHIERNPSDHASLGSGVPPLSGTASSAELELDATGSFFISTHLDLPSSENPTPRGIGIVIAELKEPRSPDVVTRPARWAASHNATAASFTLTTSPTPPVTEATVAFRARATVTIVSGGSRGRLGLDPTSNGILSRVQLGWVNNVLSSAVRVEYTSNGPVDVKYTRGPGSGTDGRVLPGDPVPTLVRHPITDSSSVVLGGEEAALSFRTMAMTAAAVGVDVVVTALDAPDIEAPESYADIAETPGSAGRVEKMELTHKFRCFLCGWTDNRSFMTATVSTPDTPGRHTYIAVAKLAWEVSGRGRFTGTSAALDGTPTTTAGPVTMLTPTEADAAGCEVREPGSLDCGRAVVK